MNKIKRTINPLHYQESEKRIIDGVFEHIHAKQEHHSLITRKPVYIFASALSIIIVLFILVFNNMSPTPNPNPIDNNPNLTSFQSRKLAEIGYLSGSIIAASQPAPTVSLMRLSNTDGTAFETNIDTINLYFDMLRVFLQDDPFANNFTVEESSNPDYDTIITFSSNGYHYQYQLKFTTESTVIGVLLFENREFIVEGSIIETDSIFEIELEAQSATNSDYVLIQYETESEDEIETNYFITSSINGVQTYREIKIERENNESNVQIKENNNEYQLEQEFENGSVVYELQYHINGVEGSARIIEIKDNLGNISYQYQFIEGDYESEFEYDRPNYNEDDEFEEDSNPVPYSTPTLEFL